MYTIHGTRKLLARAGSPVESPVVPSTALGNWYANILFWRPQIVLMVSERTLMPLLVPFAPVRELGSRIPEYLRALLESYELDDGFIVHECSEMMEHHFAKTNSMSILGKLNDYAQTAERFNGAFGPLHWLELNRRLAETPARMKGSDWRWPEHELSQVANGRLA
jgi:hypothetical protein